MLISHHKRAYLQRAQRQCRKSGSSLSQRRNSQGTQDRQARVSLPLSKQVPQTSILVAPELDRLPLMPQTSHKQYSASMASCSASKPLPSLALMRSHGLVQSLWSANSYASRVSWNEFAIPSLTDLNAICSQEMRCQCGVVIVPKASASPLTHLQLMPLPARQGVQQQCAATTAW